MEKKHGFVLNESVATKRQYERFGGEKRMMIALGLLMPPESKRISGYRPTDYSIDYHAAR